METVELIAILLAIVLGIALIILFLNKKLTPEALSGAAEVIQSLPIGENNSLFGLFLKYAGVAVLTVEQWVKTGKIEKTDQARKDTAMELVRQAAAVDDVPFGAAEQEVASACIEAKVQELPRNQIKE